jgi:NADH-quinone oxidoreductase subunit M
MTLTTLAVLVPLAAALVVGAVPRSEPGLVRALGLLGCVIELVLIATLLIGWDPEGAAVQQWAVYPWLPSFGVAWSLGLDGTVLAPLLLIGLVFPLALMIGPGPRREEPPVVVGMLVLQSAWVAVLLARDLVMLATCWEIATITMVVLLGERGDGKTGVPGRTAAARRFAAHVLPGAAALIAAVALLGVAHSHASGGTWSWDIDEVAQVVMPAQLQALGFVLVMITLATALPLVPLQGWLGPVGASGPTQVLAVLTGVGMPMAVILLQRLAIPMFPLAAGEWADPLAVIAMVGAGYAALACWAEREPGRLLGHAALLHFSLALLAVLSGTSAGRLALGPIVLAHGVGLTLLALVFGWLRRREIGNLGELAGLAAVAPRALALAIAGVLVLGGLPGTVGFFGQLDLAIVLLGGGASTDDASLELLHPRTWAVLAPLLLGLGTLGLLRSLGHAARGRPRQALLERLSEIDRREQIVGALLVGLGLGLALVIGPLAERSSDAHQRAIDDFHLGRCLAIEAREQQRPLLRDELVSLCLDPAARIRQAYGLDPVDHEATHHEAAP